MVMDIGEYKVKVLKELVNNEAIVDAIDSHIEGYDAGSPDSLIYLNLFPSLQIPKLQDSEETYILLACDVLNINAKNPTFHDMRLTIRILSHQSKNKMKGKDCTRNDFIANEIMKLLEDSLNYGYGRLRLLQNREMILNDSYTFRELSFRTQDAVKGLC